MPVSSMHVSIHNFNNKSTILESVSGKIKGIAENNSIKI